MSIQNFVHAGHKVFPCQKDKRPAKGWKWKDNHITHWDDPRLTMHPLYGWPVPRGLCVVDVDDWTNWEGGPPPATASQRTPRGNHYVYLDPDPDGPAQVRYPWGELRRHGTYMCIYNPNKEWYEGDYEPLPEFLTGGIGGTSDSGSKGNTPQTSILEVQPDFTEPAQEGKRNIQMAQYLGLKWSQGVDARELSVLAHALNAENKPPMDDDELNKIVKSIMRYPRDEPLEPGADKSVPLNRVSVAELITMDIPPVEFWQEPYGPGQAVIIYGYTGHGKSILMNEDMRDLVAKGKQVVIVDGELPWPELKKRAGNKPLQRLFYMKPEEMKDWYEYNYADDDVIVLDTKSALYTDEHSENDSEHWTVIHKFVKHWVAKGKCVVLVHHSGKSDDLRGSSNAAAPFDTTIHIKKMEDKLGNPTGEYMIKLVKDRHFLNWKPKFCTFDIAADGTIFRISEDYTP